DQVGGVRPVTCTPPSGSGFVVGATPVLCTTSDTRGNTTGASFHVNVEYPWSGFLPPVNTDGTSIFKLGSTIPVKFQLTGAAAGITNAVARLNLAKVSNGVLGPVIAATSTSQAVPDNAFRWTGGLYLFNLSTKNLSTGTWQLQIDFGDGIPHTVNVSLN